MTDIAELGGLRVVHVAKAVGMGGSERHLCDLLPGLRSRGIDAQMLLLEPPGAAVEEFTGVLTGAGVPLLRMAIRADADPVVVARLRRVLRSTDIIHSHLVHADVHVGLARCLVHQPRAKHVITIHSERREDGPATRWAMRRLAPGVDRCICISQVAASIARELLGFSEPQVKVIHYGISPPPVLSGTPAEGFTVITHSRLAPSKHVDLAVRAFAAARLSSARLVIVGAGPEEQSIRRLTTELGVSEQVVLTGYQANVWPHLASADLWLTMSSLEGFSLALAEAMGAGLPVICTEIPAHREVGADVPLFVPTGGVDECAAALRRLAGDRSLRTTLSQRGRERAELFAVAGMTDATAECYRALSSRWG